MSQVGSEVSNDGHPVIHPKRSANCIFTSKQMEAAEFDALSAASFSFEVVLDIAIPSTQRASSNTLAKRACLHHSLRKEVTTSCVVCTSSSPIPYIHTITLKP